MHQLWIDSANAWLRIDDKCYHAFMLPFPIRFRFFFVLFLTISSSYWQIFYGWIFGFYSLSHIGMPHWARFYLFKYIESKTIVCVMPISTVHFVVVQCNTDLLKLLPIVGLAVFLKCEIDFFFGSIKMTLRQNEHFGFYFERLCVHPPDSLKLVFGFMFFYFSGKRIWN